MKKKKLTYAYNYNFYKTFITYIIVQRLQTQHGEKWTNKKKSNNINKSLPQPQNMGKC